MGMFSQIAAAVEGDLVWRHPAPEASRCPGVQWCSGLHATDKEGVDHLLPVAIATTRDGVPVLRVLLTTWEMHGGGRPSKPDIYLESYNAETGDFDLQERNVTVLGSEDAPYLVNLLNMHGGEDLSGALWQAALMADRTPAARLAEVAR